MREAKIVVCTRPCGVDGRTARVAVPDNARSVVTSRGTGPRPYASSVRNSPVWPIRPAVAVNGPFSGIAEDRDGLSLDGVDEAERRRAEPRDAKDGDVVARVERDDVGVAEVAVVVVDARVLHPGDDVRVRDDEVRRRDPARAFDPEPARRPDDAEDARARQRGRPHCSSSAGSGGATRGAGPTIAENGSTRAIASSSRDGGTRALSSPRIRERWTSSRSSHLAGHVERDGAGDPDDRRPGGGAEHEPADRVERAQRRHARRGSSGSRSRPSPPRSGGGSRARRRRRARRAGCTPTRVPERNCGASLAPKYAPTTIPASEKRPRRDPAGARSAPRGRSRPPRSSRPSSRLPPY